MRPRGTRPAGALLAAARIGLLAGPAVLAFAAGGYFDEGRLWALIAAFALLAAALLAGAPPLPRTPRGLATVAALATLAGWVALSRTWSPLQGVAADDAERVALYAGALLAAVALLRPRAAARAAEPLLAAGAVVVVGYGLAGRLLPGIVHETPSLTAGGRLDQPLTYWNAMGALAAIVIVLCARLAGDGTRPRGLRVAAGAATVPLVMGLYLTYSRGAIAATLGGLLVLAVAAPSRAQHRAIGRCVVPGALAALAAAASTPVRDLAGTLAERERDGALVLAAGVVLAAVAAGLVAQAAEREREGTLRAGAVRLPRRAPGIAAALVVAILVVPIVVAGGSDSHAPAFGETGSRLTSVGSHRYDYWRVALRAGWDHPLAGVGSGGFGVEWLIHRREADSAHDAHSLEIETFAELGLVGVALLAVVLGGVALAARDAHRADAALAAGPIAALTVWAMHSAIDWDWEMPALTLVAVALAGTLLACAEEAARSRASAASTATAPSSTSDGSATNRNLVVP
jgi:hypothetical protein